MDSLPAHYVQVDALYFQTREGGLSYAIRDGKALTTDPKYRFGVRGKVAIGLPHDCWQIWLTFLHYHGRITEEKKDGPFLPIWGHPGLSTATTTESVRNRWRLHLGFLDLNLARAWPISNCVDLTPFCGLRFAGVRHKARIDYRGGFLGMEEDLSMKNKFWGIGPQVGVEGLWRLNRCLGIFSKVAGALLFGEFYLHQDEEDTQDPSLEKINVLAKYEQVRKGVDIALGVDVRKFFEGSCITLFGRISWEAYVLFHQNQLIRFTESSMPAKFIRDPGDLALYGWSFGLGIEF